MLRTAFAAAAALFMLPGVSAAAGGFEHCTAYVDAVPATLSTPGTYCLRKDLSTTATSGSAIVISSRDVTLDCVGFRLSGQADPAAYNTRAVNAGGANAVVRRCELRTFRYGVMMSSSGGSIEDNEIEDTSVGVIAFEDPSRTESGLIRVQRNRIVDSRSSGIYADGAVEVLDNLVDGVDGAPGMSMVGIDTYGDGAVVARNIVRNIAGVAGEAVYGIHSQSSNAQIRDNIVLAMPGAVSPTGIFCDPSGTVVGNQVSGWTTALSTSGCTAADNDSL